MAGGQDSMAMLAINADEHAVMNRIHKSGDEKRSVVILPPEDYGEGSPFRTSRPHAQCCGFGLHRT